MSADFSAVVLTPPANVSYTSTAKFHGIVVGQGFPVTYIPIPRNAISANTSPSGVTFAVEAPVSFLGPSETTTLFADITFPIPPPNQPLITQLSIIAYPARAAVIVSNTAPTVTGPATGSTLISTTDPTENTNLSNTSFLRTQHSSPTSGTASTSTPVSNSGPVSTSDSSSDSVVTPVTAQRASGHSTAEVAGVAIGCLIGGALVTCLLLFLLFRRRRGRHVRQSSSSEKELSPLNGHGEAIYLAGGYEKAWEKQLPPTKSDVATGNAARSILDQIEMHVDSFYQDTCGLNLSIEAQSELEDLDSSHLPASILTLVSQAKRPSLLIKHCIINFIISRITPGGARVAASFLPKEFAGMKPFSQSHADSDAGYHQALAQWRVLTAYLNQDFTRDNTYTTERDQAIATAAQQVCRAFEPWARNNHNVRLQGITTIMKKVSDLGITLCSQQPSFEWRWEMSDGPGMGTREPVQFVVRPGLDRTTDQSAMPLTVAMHLLEPQIAVLDRV